MYNAVRLWRALTDAVFPPRVHEALVRAAGNDALARQVHPMQVIGASSSGIPGQALTVISLLRYTDPLVQAAIREAKFHANDDAARMLGNALRAFLESQSYEGTFLIPIPLSPARQTSRGYNQVEHIAMHALQDRSARLLTGIQFAPNLLVRTRDTPPQTSLNRAERLRNLTGAFSCPHPLDPAAHYLVLDDVTTTGATLAAATTALFACGARHVSSLALAH